MFSPSWCHTSSNSGTNLKLHMQLQFYASRLITYKLLPTLKGGGKVVAPHTFIYVSGSHLTCAIWSSVAKLLESSRAFASFVASCYQLSQIPLILTQVWEDHTNTSGMNWTPYGIPTGPVSTIQDKSNSFHTSTKEVLPVNSSSLILYSIYV